MKIILLSFLGAIILSVAILLAGLPPSFYFQSTQLDAHLLMNPSPNLFQRLAMRVALYDLVKIVIEDQVSLSESDSELDRVVKILKPFKNILASQLQVDHLPSGRSTILSGLGFCDQINSVAATAIAQHFEKVEMVGIEQTPLHGGHSLGRVLLPESQTWIYFDLWPEELFLIESKSELQQGFKILYRTKKSKLPTELEKIYSDLPKAKSYLEFAQTPLGYIWRQRGRPRLDFANNLYQSTAPRQIAIPDDGSHPELVNVYLNARLNHLKGNFDQAFQFYQKVAETGAAQSEWVLASQFFLKLLAPRRDFDRDQIDSD